MADRLLDPFWDFLDAEAKDEQGHLPRSVLLIGGIAWCVPKASVGEEEEGRESATAITM